MHIWLDDFREAPDYYVDDEGVDIVFTVCRTFEDVEKAFLVCAIYGVAPELMCFDHDLGLDQPTGYDIIKWIANTHPNLYPDQVTCHSANPAGCDNIMAFDKNWREQNSGSDSHTSRS